MGPPCAAGWRLTSCGAAALPARCDGREEAPRAAGCWGAGRWAAALAAAGPAAAGASSRRVAASWSAMSFMGLVNTWKFSRLGSALLQGNRGMALDAVSQPGSSSCCRQRQPQTAAHRQVRFTSDGRPEPNAKPLPALAAVRYMVCCSGLPIRPLPRRLRFCVLVPHQAWHLTFLTGFRKTGRAPASLAAASMAANGGEVAGADGHQGAGCVRM